MYAKVAWPCYVPDISGMQYEEIRQNSCPYRTCHPHMVAQSVKNLPAVQETWVQSLGREDPLEKEMANHSSILAGEFHGQRSLEGCSPWVARVRHDLATKPPQSLYFSGVGKINMS